MEPPTAYIVGGGPAGLLSAIHLARAGLGVTVLEARSGLGGRASSESRDGLDVNQGPHALYVGGAAKRELAAVGIDPPGWRPGVLTKTVWLRDGRARWWTGAAGDVLAVTRWALRPPGPAAALAGRSAADWLASGLPSPGARRLGAALVRVATQVADLEALGADAAAAQVAIAVRPGVRYLGGWQALVDRLAATARQAGAAIETRRPVRALAREDGRWALHTDAGPRTADVVVLAAGGPERAARLLGGELAAPGPVAEVAALDLALHRLPRPRRAFALGLDSPHYFAIHSAPGRRPVHVSLAAHLTAEDRTSGTRAALEAVADAVQPGWRRELLAEPRHLARMASHTAIPSAGAGGLAGRPAVCPPEWPGLALAGDWVGGEGILMDAALASARVAAESLKGARVAVPA